MRSSAVSYTHLDVYKRQVYMDTEERYSELVNILVKDQNLPDIMVVTDREILKELVENDLVEDLTEVFEKCTSSRIKEMYESYGDALLDVYKRQVHAPEHFPPPAAAEAWVPFRFLWKNPCPTCLLYTSLSLSAVIYK